MRLTKSSFEIIPQAEGLEGMYKQVELAARNCYQSFDKTTEDSYKKLLEHLGNNGHMSPFAHGTVYLKFPLSADKTLYNHIQEYQNNFWSKVKIETGFERGTLSDNGYYVTTNLRVLKENNWLHDLNFWCEPTEFHPKRTTVKINCSIGISRELNRHSTVLSIAESSTRYCNYSKDKFGSEITFVLPEWVKKHDYFGCREEYAVDRTNQDVACWYKLLEESEKAYLNLISKGCRSQEAREVLPLSTATSVVYTAFDSDWKEVFAKRTTNACHPDMIAIMIPLEEEFKKLDKIN